MLWHIWIMGFQIWSLTSHYCKRIKLLYGCIFEVKVDDRSYPGFKDGRSIGGGGRYDDLTGVFGFKNVSGFGVSFGAEHL